MTKTVLIVDDEPNIVLSVAFLMKREGHTVLTAGDGQEALETLAATSPT